MSYIQEKDLKDIINNTETSSHSLGDVKTENKYTPFKSKNEFVTYDPARKFDRSPLPELDSNERDLYC